MAKLTLDLQNKDTALVLSNTKEHYDEIVIKNPRVVKSLHPLLRKVWEMLKTGGELKGDGYTSRNLGVVKTLNHFCGEVFWLSTAGGDWSIEKTGRLPFRERILRLPYTEDHLGGLGDLLLYNHIPRLLKTIGGVDRVVVETKFRSPEYKKLIYDNNPYIDEVRPPDPKELRFLSSANWIEKKIETAQFYPNPYPVGKGGYHDLVAEYYDVLTNDRLIRPDFYYQPKFLSEYQNKIIWDGNFTSGNTAPSQEFIYGVLKDKKIDLQIAPLSTHFGPVLPGVPSLQTSSLEHLIDIIHSCKEFWGYDTGHNHVAYALNKKIHVFTRAVPYNTEIRDISTYLWHYPYFHEYHVEKL